MRNNKKNTNKYLTIFNKIPRHFLVLGVVIILMNIGLMFVHEPPGSKRQEDQRTSDQIIEKDLSSAKKNYLKILGGILLIFSILELLPEFPTTKNLFPFLPLTSTLASVGATLSMVSLTSFICLEFPIIC